MQRSGPEQSLRFRRPRAGWRLRGAIAALATALVGVLVATESAPEGTEDLARLAMAVPAAIYVGWWLFVPGFAGNSADAGESSSMPATDPELLRTTFDDAGVYASMRKPAGNVDQADQLRNTIRVGGGDIPSGMRPIFRSEGAVEADSASGGS